MARVVLGFVCAILVLVWCLTGAVHWGGAIFESLLAVFGGLFVFIYGAYCNCRNMACGGWLAPFRGISWIGAGICLMVMVAALELIPMPFWLLDIFSPMSSASYREAWQLFGEAGKWGFLTASFDRTAFGLVQLCGFLGVFLIGLRLGGLWLHVRVMSWVAVGCGGILLTWLVLEMGGVAFHIGEAGESSAWRVGFPVNPNHASGIFVVLSLVSLGAFFTRRHRHALARRVLWGIVYLCFGVAIWSLRSRGALLSWVIGQVFLILFLIGRKRISPKLASHCGILFLIVVCAVCYVNRRALFEVGDEVLHTQVSFSVSEDARHSGFALDGGKNGHDLMTLDDGEREVAEKTFVKTQMYGDFVTMLGEWWRSGVGYQAFSDVYPAYQSFYFQKRFRHAENVYWEWLLEYGIVVGAAVIFLIFGGLWRVIRQLWRASDEHPVVIGWLSGIVALLIQNFFDFGVRYWVVGFLFWGGCGMLVARGQRWEHANDGAGMMLARRLKYEWRGVVCVCGACLALCLSILPHAVRGQNEREINSLPERFLSVGDLDKEAHPYVLARVRYARLRRIVAQAWVRRGSGDEGRAREWDYARARAWLESAVGLDRHDVLAMLSLAKVCRALGDGGCARQYFALAGLTDARVRMDAMREIVQLDRANWKLGIGEERLQKSLAMAFVERWEFAQAFELSGVMKKMDESLAVRIEIFRALGMPEAMDLEISRFNEHEMTLVQMLYREDSYKRHGKYRELMAFLSRWESEFAHEERYWRIRMLDTVWYGRALGDLWYRSECERLLLKYRILSPDSGRYQFYLWLGDAKFAFETGQYGRAWQSARKALRLRPGNREAAYLLSSSQRKREESVISAGGMI